jgi:hypothetical protein
MSIDYESQIPIDHEIEMKRNIRRFAHAVLNVKPDDIDRLTREIDLHNKYEDYA